MPIPRSARYLTGGLIGLIAAALAAGGWAYRDIPARVLESRYASPASLFINLDGVRMHFRDEGSGPPLVLIHGELSSLIDWDPWVGRMRDRFRLLRLDLPGHGLTRPDPREDYSIARSVDLVERFAEALALRRFSIAASSTSAAIAVRYAARHPDRVAGLVLLNPDLAGSTPAHRFVTTAPEWLLDLLTRITPAALPRLVLQQAYADPGRVDEALVNRWHDLWLGERQRETLLTRLRRFDPTGIDDDLARITAPTLILQGTAVHQPVAGIGRTIGLMHQAPRVSMIRYPDAGLWPALESPYATARDVAAFLLPADNRHPDADTDPSR